MIALGVGDAARHAGGGAIHREAVGAFVRLESKLTKSGDEDRDPIAFLDAQLRGAAHADLAAAGGERRDRRQLIDEARYFLGRNLDRSAPICFDDDGAARLASGL